MPAQHRPLLQPPPPAWARAGQEGLENGGTRSGERETALATPPARPIPGLQGPVCRLSHLPRPGPRGGRYLLWSASRAPRGTGCERGKRPGQGSASLARRPAEETSRVRAGGQTEQARVRASPGGMGHQVTGGLRGLGVGQGRPGVQPRWSPSVPAETGREGLGPAAGTAPMGTVRSLGRPATSSADHSPGHGAQVTQAHTQP